MKLLALCALALLAAPAQAQTPPPGPRGVVDLEKAFSHEPDVREVHRWVQEESLTNPEAIQTWLKQSRAAAALPQLTLTYDYDNENNWGYGYTEVIPEEPEEYILEDQDQDRDHFGQARVRWDLNELIMSSEQIRVIAQAEDMVKLRDKLLEEATRIYFDRRRLQVELLLTPPPDVKGRMEAEVQLLELTARLDSLTGGRFSEGIQKTPEQP